MTVEMKKRNEKENIECTNLKSKKYKRGKMLKKKQSDNIKQKNKRKYRKQNKIREVNGNIK